MRGQAATGGLSPQWVLRLNNTKNTIHYDGPTEKKGRIRFVFKCTNGQAIDAALLKKENRKEKGCSLISPNTSPVQRHVAQDLLLTWAAKWAASVGGAHIIARYALQLAWNTCAFQGRSLPSSKFLSHIHHDFCPAFIKVSVPPSSRFLPYFTQSMFFFFKRNLFPISMGR